ncbi:hypothetical protein L596_019809 [Steinernema carpocapsae]|uniref:Uncharacterized protein n=1 Tax=Steinernema carpocapsae TaxID=34508 RepID=A0A4U5MRQ2_STECR|nr:hypothetical protein L596_019809 [Steinernema carpocapsae]
MLKNLRRDIDGLSASVDNLTNNNTIVVEMMSDWKSKLTLFFAGLSSVAALGWCSFAYFLASGFWFGPATSPGSSSRCSSPLTPSSAPLYLRSGSSETSLHDFAVELSLNKDIKLLTKFEKILD